MKLSDIPDMTPDDAEAIRAFEYASAAVYEFMEKTAPDGDGYNSAIALCGAIGRVSVVGIVDKTHIRPMIGELVWNLLTGAATGAVEYNVVETEDAIVWHDTLIRQISKDLSRMSKRDSKRYKRGATVQ